MAEKSKVLCLYVPVVYQGYIDLFTKYSNEARSLFVFSRSIINEFSQRGLEKRAINPITAVRLISSLNIFSVVETISKSEIEKLKYAKIIMVNDGISRRFAEKYLVGFDIEYDTVFLRWDETNVFSQEPVDGITISTEDFHKNIMRLAVEASHKSSDWWRQVGAVAIKDGKMIGSYYNQHMPSEFTPYMNGDPRDSIEPGQHSELCSAIHSEQDMVAEAASKVLAGADVYVSTFPCPVCAKLLAKAGIKRCFFKSGHASLDGQSIFKHYGIEAIKVSP